jgi:hypothetical protein
VLAPFLLQFAEMKALHLRRKPFFQCAHRAYRRARGRAAPRAGMRGSSRVL